MKFLSQFFIVVSIFISSIVAVSSNFTLTLSSSDSAIKSLAVVTNGYDIFVANLTGSSTYSSLTGIIQGDGSLKLGTDSYVGISKNYLTVTSNTTEIASPFKVKDGSLYLYDSKDFKAIPSGDSNVWIVGSSSASSTASSVYTIGIKALDSDGKKISDFSISSSGASPSKKYVYSMFTLTPLAYAVYASIF